MRRNSRSNKKGVVEVDTRSATRENSFGMLSGIFDNGGYGTISPSSMPNQLAGSNAYNPLTLNRILLSYAYSTYGIIQTFIDQPVEDAFRGGVTIETDELDEEDLDLLEDVLVECHDYKEMKDAMKWAKLFGGAGLIINTNQDPTEELDVKSIGEDTPLSFIAADRWELLLNYLVKDSVDTPYNYYGQVLHKTRVIKVMGKEAPSFLRQRLQGWGMSELERTIRDINAYTKNQDVIFELLDEAKIDIWQIDGFNSNLLSANSQQQITKRMNLATQLKNFSKALIMDKNDGYEQKQIGFSGLAEMQQQNRMGVAASVRMPMTKLFGQSAAGFNSGEDDIENYNAIVESEVRAKARELVNTVVKLRCQQLFGFIPEHFEVKFQPLRILGAEQEENILSSKFNRASAMYAQGVLDGEEYATLLKKEGLLTMKTKVGDGIREPEPPHNPAMDIDMPQKVTNLKYKSAREEDHG